MRRPFARSAPALPRPGVRVATPWCDTSPPEGRSRSTRSSTPALLILPAVARRAISREHAAVVVEGYFDVIAAHSAGVQHTVASSGTALTREQVRHLGRLATMVTLCFDTDDAGWAAASRAVDVLAAEGVQGR